MTIENDFLRVNAVSKGAELTSIFNKKTGLEYLWSADPKFWGKHSPILFPIVGTLKQDTYNFVGRSYKLSRHGFAREKDFTTSEQTADSVTFSLKADDQSKLNFPFDFKLAISYTLDDDRLIVKYLVYNSSEESMFFSIGGHPAFRLPLEPGLKYDDYKLTFAKKETADRWPISADGLIFKESIPLLQSSDTLALNKELFLKDALVFKDLKSRSVQLTSTKGTAGLEFNFEGFPYLGLWAAKNADFLCIEPWCGIADSVDSDQNFESKEGIQSLKPKTEFIRSWSVRTF